MFKDAVRNVEGLGLYPTISFVIFFLFFIGLLVYVYGITKKHSNTLGNLPFEDNEIDSLNENKKIKTNEKDL